MERFKTVWRLFFRWFKFGLKWAFVFAAVVALIVVVGLIPKNNDFEPAAEGIELFVVSNSVHADIIVPKQTEIIDWGETFSETSFVRSVENETHVAIGWGDRGFFLETKTWDDFRFATAANAVLLPSESCLHVSFTRPARHSEAVSVTITSEQYKELVDFITQSFAHDSEGKIAQIEGESYGETDAFFEANGRYHLFNTCNSWVGRGLSEAGIKVPLYCPLPKTPMLYIESE